MADAQEVRALVHRQRKQPANLLDERSLAALAKEDVPDSVAALYGLRAVKFGPDYLIPFPFDPRALLWVAPAVAWAAVASGVARDFCEMEEYRQRLERGVDGRGAHARALRAVARVRTPA